MPQTRAATPDMSVVVSTSVAAADVNIMRDEIKVTLYPLLVASQVQLTPSILMKPSRGLYRFSHQINAYSSTRADVSATTHYICPTSDHT